MEYSFLTAEDKLLKRKRTGVIFMRKRQKTGFLLGVCVLSMGIGAVNASAYTVAVPKKGEEAMELICPECGAAMEVQEAAGTELAVESDENSYYYTWEGDAESTVEAVAEDSAETVKDTEREKEYAEIGITVSRDGTWLYDGEEISFLLDEDQGVYSNDTDGKEKLYVYVSRDADGKVEQAQVVDGGELIERMAELDSKE